MECSGYKGRNLTRPLICTFLYGRFSIVFVHQHYLWSFQLISVLDLRARLLCTVIKAQSREVHFQTDYLLVISIIIKSMFSVTLISALNSSIMQLGKQTIYSLWSRNFSVQFSLKICTVYYYNLLSFSLSFQPYTGVFTRHKYCTKVMWWHMVESSMKSKVSEPWV